MTEFSLARWVRVTWLGWILGFVFIIVLASAGEALGLGGNQVLVGLGMGAGVGLLQGRALRPLLHRSGPWILVCLVGLGLPFLATDLAQVAGHALPYSLPLAVTLGGLLVGLGQAYLLRPHVRPVSAWVFASLVGWSLAAGTASLADGISQSHSLRGIAGALAYLGTVAGGGLLLGLVTGGALVWLQRRAGAAIRP